MQLYDAELITKLNELERKAYLEGNTLALEIYNALDEQLNATLDNLDSKTTTVYAKQDRIDKLKARIIELEETIQDLNIRFVK